MLRIAVQAKGRLNEESTALLKEIGIEIDDSKRKYISKASNFPVEMLYLRDDDIPGVVANGSADLGIVGLNEVVEKGYDVQIVEKLGFGGCRLSLAIPKGDEYEGVSYFEGKKIATSYPAILNKFLKDNNINATVEVITGSVEIAPAACIADAIFDIVSSGSTLIANNLKEVEVVLESEAVLIGSGTLSPESQAILDEIRFRMESARISHGKKYILMNIPENAIDKAIEILPAMRSPTIMPLAAKGWCSLHSVVDKENLWTRAQQWEEIGAEGKLILNDEKIIL